jgi:hypothetical protein
VVFGSFSAVEGNLIITNSQIRFEPGFPGLIQNRLLSYKSTFEKNCQLINLHSSDPRIIPRLLKNTIEPNSRGDLLNIQFDPSAQAQMVEEEEGIFDTS